MEFCLSSDFIIVDLARFYGVALRVRASGGIFGPNLSLRYSSVILKCLFLDRNVRGILTSFIISTCSLAKDTCCVVFYFDNISDTICAAILSALYLLSLLLTDSDISHLLSLFLVNIADTCVAVTATSATRRL